MQVTAPAGHTLDPTVATELKVGSAALKALAVYHSTGSA